MCVGVPMFADNKKALFGKKTNSHSTACEMLGINEDRFRKYEYHWWKKELVDEHYDRTAEEMLSFIKKSTSDKLIKQLIKKELHTPEQLYKWLKDVKEEWDYLPEMKNGKEKDYLYKKITGWTVKENETEMKKAIERANLFTKRVEKIKWFTPKPIVSKKEITLSVDACLNLFKFPRVKIDFKYLNTVDDWSAARSAARSAAESAAESAARSAAWSAAWSAAESAARSAAWSAARSAAWSAAESAAGLITKDIKSYKKLYKDVPFLKMVDLFEMGLYPIGVVDNTFLIYVPLVNSKRPVIK